MTVKFSWRVNTTALRKPSPYFSKRIIPKYVEPLGWKVVDIDCDDAKHQFVYNFEKTIDDGDPKFKTFTFDYSRVYQPSLTEAEVDDLISAYDSQMSEIGYKPYLITASTYMYSTGHRNDPGEIMFDKLTLKYIKIEKTKTAKKRSLSEISWKKIIKYAAILLGIGIAVWFGVRATYPLLKRSMMDVLYQELALEKNNLK